MKRGEIWWVTLGEPRGSEPGFRRPIVIVSSDAFNDSAINTVLAAVITSNTRLADAPGNIRLPKRVSKLNQQFLGSLNEGLALVMGL
ncbi:MAG: mRNA interferase MazF2 [Gammaproteobacteria bacterium]|nr:MAG: mRNA interferase MazF2 [Gammaproteobacteria bacterium]